MISNASSQQIGCLTYNNKSIKDILHAMREYRRRVATMLPKSQHCHNIAQDAVRELDGAMAALWS